MAPEPFAQKPEEVGRTPEPVQIDLSQESVPERIVQQQRVPFDPEPQRERLRGWIAISLLGMLAFVLLCSFVSMWIGIDKELLQTVLTIIVGPLIALVSAATGFYYGSRSRQA
jgi:hypothetical protein